MLPLQISKTTHRRFILGRQGLWPGRRWRGKAGTAAAIQACEAVQMDPLVMVARSHDLVLHSRVLGYQSGYLDKLMYGERRFFDYGGGLFFYPMSELPYWRLHMRRRGEHGRWGPDFVRKSAAVLDQVRAALRERGPLGNRDLDGKFLETWNYRGGKDTSLAFFYLWLTGELMTHHRRGFERVYDFRDHVAPKEFDYAASDGEAEDFFALKGIAFFGLMREAAWRTDFAGWIWREVTPEEARRRLDALQAEGVIAPVKVEGTKETFLALTGDLPLLETLESGKTPRPWKPLQTATLDEVTFLAPLDIVSARGRAKKVFDFEYIWEVYKPEDKRRWGYYVLPILYGDRLVARLDPKLDRPNQTLQVKGFWLEDLAPVKDPAFAAALARGLVRFARFLNAARIDLGGMPNPALKRGVKSFIQEESELKVK